MRTEAVALLEPTHTPAGLARVGVRRYEGGGRRLSITVDHEAGIDGHHHIRGRDVLAGGIHTAKGRGRTSLFPLEDLSALRVDSQGLTAREHRRAARSIPLLGDRSLLAPLGDEPELPMEIADGALAELLGAPLRAVAINRSLPFDGRFVRYPTVAAEVRGEHHFVAVGDPDANYLDRVSVFVPDPVATRSAGRPMIVARYAEPGGETPYMTMVGWIQRGRFFNLQRYEQSDVALDAALAAVERIRRW